MKQLIIFLFFSLILSVPVFSQDICEGTWSGTSGLFLDFKVVDQNTIEFESIRISALCAFVFASIPSATITNNSFLTTFGGGSGSFYGTITGTFSENGQSMTGTYVLNINICNETRSGTGMLNQILRVRNQ